MTSHPEDGPKFSLRFTEAMSGHNWSPETRAEFALLAHCGYRDGCTCAACLRSVLLTKAEATPPPASNRASDVRVCGLLRTILSGQVLHALAKMWASPHRCLDKTTWAECMSADTVKDKDMQGSRIQFKSATARRKNPFPLIMNDVPPLIMNIPGGQKFNITRGAYLLREFGRDASKFFLKSTKVCNWNSF